MPAGAGCSDMGTDWSIVSCTVNKVSVSMPVGAGCGDMGTDWSIVSCSVN